MPNLTPNYNFNLPLVNNATDADLWGGQLNSNWSDLDTLLQASFELPVGSIYMNKTVSTNPATLLGYGTWTAIEDVFLVARGSTYTGTGGAATDSITLSSANMPPHTHTYTATSEGTGSGNEICKGGGSGPITVTSSSTGSGSAFTVDTVPPYQAVYTWERTA